KRQVPDSDLFFVSLFEANVNRREDGEGGEVPALAGAARLLSGTRQRFCKENIWTYRDRNRKETIENHGSRKELFAQLWPSGFSIVCGNCSYSPRSISYHSSVSPSASLLKKTVFSGSFTQIRGFSLRNRNISVLPDDSPS